jgi:N-acetylglucosaminyldiphosphoundecaprenol N-acetyl-beta-D-mannosaminyltransferase
MHAMTNQFPEQEGRDRTVEVFGIPLDNVTMAEARDTILGWLNDASCRQVCFVNADCANIAYRDKEYLSVLQEADYCLADGIGLKLAGKIFRQEIRENVNGTDLFPLLCERLAATDRRVFLLGARPGVPEGVQEWIRNRFPLLDVCGVQHGYFGPQEEEGVIERIRDSGANLVLVAFGAPKQDLWIHEHMKEMGANVAIGVGGLFDFYSGRIPRAPLWMRKMGMEWVYRLVQEPGRLWKRYLIGNGLFLARVVREKYSSQSKQ